MDNLFLDKLIERISNEDRNALGELYDITSNNIFGYALSIVCNKSVAEDIMHDVYIQVFHNAKSYKAQGKAMAWMLRITRNISYNMLKRQKFESVIPYDEIDNTLLQNNTNNNELNELIDQIVLNELLIKLPTKERQIIILYLFVGMSQKEISKITRTPLPTVKWRYKNALKKLSAVISSNKKEEVNYEKF